MKVLVQDLRHLNHISNELQSQSQSGVSGASLRAATAVTQRERWLAVSSETPLWREKTGGSVKGQSNNWATERVNSSLFLYDSVAEKLQVWLLYVINVKLIFARWGVYSLEQQWHVYREENTITQDVELKVEEFLTVLLISDGNSGSFQSAVTINSQTTRCQFFLFLKVVTLWPSIVQVVIKLISSLNNSSVCNSNHRLILIQSKEWFTQSTIRFKSCSWFNFAKNFFLFNCTKAHSHLDLFLVVLVLCYVCVCLLLNTALPSAV